MDMRCPLVTAHVYQSVCEGIISMVCVWPFSLPAQCRIGDCNRSQPAES
jgi:hypothetical protein